jgi:hypothetical protein
LKIGLLSSGGVENSARFGGAAASYPARASPHFSHSLRSGGPNVTPALPQAAASL